MAITYTDKAIHDWLHQIRLMEIESLLNHLPKGENLKLLEIGGGDGYLASLLAKEGYQVTSVDLEPRFPQSFPVQKVSGSNLHFSDNEFDIIFSSHVLEHVTDLRLMLSELNRVAKSGATIVHVMPTPAWRIITSFWVLLYLPSRFLMILRGSYKAESDETEPPSASGEQSQLEGPKKKSKVQKLKRMIFHPHGEYPSFIHEIYYFSAFRWKKVLKANDQKCTRVERGPLLYSGLSLFKFKFMGFRKFVSKYLFSSGNTYVIEK